MTRDEARAILEQEEDCVNYHSWSWFGLSMSCCDSCCSDYYDTVEEALNGIEFYCGGKWENVK